MTTDNNTSSTVVGIWKTNYRGIVQYMGAVAPIKKVKKKGCRTCG